MDSPYKVLGLKENEDFSIVKSTYRKLVLLYHPDKNTTVSSDYFDNIVNAYKKICSYKQFGNCPLDNIDYNIDNDFVNDFVNDFSNVLDMEDVDLGSFKVEINQDEATEWNMEFEKFFEKANKPFDDFTRCKEGYIEYNNNYDITRNASELMEEMEEFRSLNVGVNTDEEFLGNFENKSNNLNQLIDFDKYNTDDLYGIMIPGKYQSELLGSLEGNDLSVVHSDNQIIHYDESGEDFDTEYEYNKRLSERDVFIKPGDDKFNYVFFEDDCLNIKDDNNSKEFNKALEKHNMIKY